MSSSLKSFNLSLVFHVIVVVVISLFIRKNEQNEIVESKRFITMNFGSSSVGVQDSGSTAKKTEVSNTQLKETIVDKNAISISNSSPNISNSQASANTSESTTLDGNGLEYGEGHSFGNGTGSSQEFNSSVLNYSEPLYPRMALRRGLEGSLKVRIKINSQGIPEETILLKSSGFDLLDNSALEAIKGWVFVRRESVAYYFVEKTIIFQITK